MADGIIYANAYKGEHQLWIGWTCREHADCNVGSRARRVGIWRIKLKPALEEGTTKPLHEEAKP